MLRTGWKDGAVRTLSPQARMMRVKQKANVKRQSNEILGKRAKIDVKLG